MNFKKLTIRIPDILLAQLAGFSLVYGLTSSLCVTYPPLKILLLVMLCVTVLFILFYNRKTSLAAAVLLGASAVAFVVYIAFGPGIRKVLVFLDGYFYWLGDFIQYPDVPDPLYQLITVLSLSILLSVFSYIFIVKRFLFGILFAAGIGMFTVQWSYNIVASLVPFYLFLLVTLIAYMKHIHAMKTANTSNDYTATGMITLWSLPLCALIIALASSIHASSKPIEWKWLDKKIVSVYNYLNKNLDYETFDYFSLSASSGFGDRNNLLGGRVRLDRTNVLQVKTEKNVYLKGASSDIYTGTTWINSTPEKTPTGSNYGTVYTDTAEMLQGMKLLTGGTDFVEKLLTPNKVSVIFLNLKTKSLFLPSKTTVFKPDKGGMNISVDSSGVLSSEQRLAKGFAYTVEMYSPQLGSEEFSNILRKSKKGLYIDYILKNEFPTYFLSVRSDQSTKDSTNTITDATNTTTLSALDVSVSLESSPLLTSPGAIAAVLDNPVQTYHDVRLMRDRSEQIYKRYLQLPQNLPQRVKDLSASLVSSYNNNYDKAKAIEQYLASNYPYNLDVRSTPRNRDFVDYFLFDLKQGYCSYYASAMVVLARSAGLPARYAEGYILPPEPVKNSSSTYVVTNMQAHAWAEIYFEGYGWLPFEPTSPFRASFYADTDTDAVYASSYSPAYDDYMEMMRRYGNNRDPGMDIGEVNVQEQSNGAVIGLLTFGGVAVLLIALLLFQSIRSRYRFYKLVNLPARECILKSYDYYVSVLNLQGLGLKPAETPFQYSGRIDSSMFFSPVKFKAITDIFVKARYSLKEINESEKQLFCEFHQGFLNEVKTYMGKFKFFLYKYMLGKF